MELEGADRLPRPSDLSLQILHYLNEQFQAQTDLSRSPDVLLELRNQCCDLEASLADLSHRLSEGLTAYATHSNDVCALVGTVRSSLVDQLQRAGISSREREEIGRRGNILGEELPALAREVARVETVRSYAETALKLDSLVGDVEDAVSSSVVGKLKSPQKSSSEETLMVAISSLKKIEDILASIAKTRPEWIRLISAVDLRIDRALAILRPQAIADHRSLLSSLGWPPPLSSSSLSAQNTAKSSESSNPLLTMKGELKGKYSTSFLSLCHLQELQFQRKARYLDDYCSTAVDLHQPLWVVEELVNPIMLVSQHHFSKWVDTPEFIFALILKITRDFVDSMDNVLQPWADRARIMGYSCREEWVSAMAASLSSYLAKEIFPRYTENIESHSLRWLQLIDLMISFDKRMQTLLISSGFPISLREDERLQRRLSVLSVFCDRPDWLDIWAEIELGEALEKLKSAMQMEKNWKTNHHGTNILMSLDSQDNFKSPAVSNIFLNCLSLIIDRSRMLPAISLRSRFIKLAGLPLIREFSDCLLRRCQESEGLTALVDDDAVISVSHSINVARHCESTLTEWGEDVFFLEIEIDGGSGCIFEEELRELKNFPVDWSKKISAVILRGFDARCREYLKNKKQWQQEKSEDSRMGLRAFVAALDFLQDKISKLEEELNAIDFTATWRGVAAGVDQLLFTGVIIGGMRFSDAGVVKLMSDVSLVLGVFSTWCLRPEGFFSKLSDAVKLLRMEEMQLRYELVEGKDIWLKENGIRHLTLLEAEKIGKSRFYN